MQIRAGQLTKRVPIAGGEGTGTVADRWEVHSIHPRCFTYACTLVSLVVFCPLWLAADLDYCRRTSQWKSHRVYCVTHCYVSYMDDKNKSVHLLSKHCIIYCHTSTTNNNNDNGHTNPDTSFRCWYQYLSWLLHLYWNMCQYNETVVYVRVWQLYHMCLYCR